MTICIRLVWYDTLLGYLDGNAGCPTPGFVTYTFVGPCQTGCVNVNLPPGPAWIFVATAGFGPEYLCGMDYYFTVEGLSCPVSVERTSWAEIKAGYGE